MSSIHTPLDYYSTPEIRHEEVQSAAYELYLRLGCKTEDSLEHWLEAEALVRLNRSVSPFSYRADSRQ
jgi:Protein of unknown function (DUF2934)